MDDQARTTTGLSRIFEIGETVKAQWMEKCVKHDARAYHRQVKMGGLGLPMFATKSLAVKAINKLHFGNKMTLQNVERAMLRTSDIGVVAHSLSQAVNERVGD